MNENLVSIVFSSLMRRVSKEAKLRNAFARNRLISTYDLYPPAAQAGFAFHHSSLRDHLRYHISLCGDQQPDQHRQCDAVKENIPEDRTFLAMLPRGDTGDDD